MASFYNVNVEVAKVMDKPSLHRIVELTENTLPRYGLIQNVIAIFREHKHVEIKSTYRSSYQMDSTSWDIRKLAYHVFS